VRGSGSLGVPAMSRERLAMMGQQDRSFAALPPVSLDALVPADHRFDANPDTTSQALRESLS
jgi:hypothetical protein